MQHFWKVFAATALIGAGYLAVDWLQGPRRFIDAYAKDRQAAALARKPISQIVAKLAENQDGPATVVLSGSGERVRGNLYRADESFVTLETYNPSSGTTQTILIPMENVAWIESYNKMK